MKHKPQVSPKNIRDAELRATVFGICFASLVAIAGIAVGLKPSVLADLAAYHQKACTDNPVLLSWTQHVIPIMPLFFGFLLVLPLGRVGWTVLQQVREISRIKYQVHLRSNPPPLKLAGAARALGLGDRVIYVQDQAAYAFCFGVARPRICVSAGMVNKLSRPELEAVLLHEASHLQNRDPFRMLVSHVVTSALLLLPVANELRERYHLSMELAADRRALARVPVEVLASALLKLLATGGDNTRYQLTSVGALNVTRERIARLAGNADRGGVPPLPRHSLLSSTFVALAIFGGTVGFSGASDYWATQAHSCRPVAASRASDNVFLERNVPVQTCSHADEGIEVQHE